ncbi:MAG: DNA polymerase I [Oscillospiraceae bacterium]
MKLMILDGNSIVNRAFYGVRMLNAPDGTPTNGVYGFLAILQRMLELETPEALCVAFDLSAPTFRHKQYDGYKAQRKPMPEELAVQMPLLKQTLDAMGVRRLELEGYEADDLLGTVGKRCESAGWECVIVTGDKDSFQLITDTTHVCHVKTRMGQTETVEYTPEVFRAEYGFDPIRMVDLKALMGDSSDNIPGVPGIGEKTAKDLIARFGTIEAIYRELDTLDVKEGVRKKLREGRESAELSFELATICTDAPIPFSPAEAVWNHDYQPELYGLFRRLGFSKFIEKWGLQPETDAEVQTSSVLPQRDVTDSAALQTLTERVTAAPYVAVLPVDGLDSLALCDGEACYTLSWAQLGDGYNAFLRTLFSDRVRKVSHNVKDLMRLLLDEGLPTDGFVFDTALAGYLLNATAANYDLSGLAAGYLSYGCPDAQAAFALYPVLEQKLQALGMTQLYDEIELPLCAVLAEMEQTGFLVDRQALYDFGQSLTSGIAQLQESIWELAGESFNINSPKQLGTILFDKLMLPSGKKTKTGWSTNADVLEKLRGKHPIIEQILDYRMLTKLKSTYADGLLKEISADGRIHTNFQMTVTATGRLSSTEPNLQNIPVRRELGGQIRRMFVASPGKVLVDADYSQIELRLLAHISGDETMIRAFQDGEDIHAVTASQVFDVPLSEVTSLQRSRAKAVNFGIVYGISAFSLAQDIGVFQNEAKAYMDSYFAKYHGVREYMKRIVEQAKHDGYVTTLFGRRRELPELKASNFNVRSFGERVALNMPIQGTAADIIKAAMVHVARRMKAEGLQARLLLQVHDELIVECPEQEAEHVRALLVEEMEHVVAYSVPLDVDAKIGASWAEAH